MSRPERERLEPVLASMLGKPRRLERLATGTTGTTYLVETDSGRFAAKAFSPACFALLGPEAQFRLLEVLCGRQIAPRPVGFDVGARLLVTEYLAGAAAVTADALTSGVRLAELAAGLRQLHGVTVDVPRFDPEADARRYVESMGGLNALGRRDRGRFEELIELVECFPFRASTLCHNDLVASNLLFANGLKLIDFDYAVLASPELDLASVAVMNRLSDRGCSRLLSAYYPAAVPLSLAEFARVQRVVRLLAHFWALASTAAFAAVSASAAMVGQYRIGHG